MTPSHTHLDILIEVERTGRATHTRCDKQTYMYLNRSGLITLDPKYLSGKSWVLTTTGRQVLESARRGAFPGWTEKPIPSDPPPSLPRVVWARARLANRHYKAHAWAHPLSWRPEDAAPLEVPSRTICGHLVTPESYLTPASAHTTRCIRCARIARGEHPSGKIGAT